MYAIDPLSALSLHRLGERDAHRVPTTTRAAVTARPVTSGLIESMRAAIVQRFQAPAEVCCPA